MTLTDEQRAEFEAAHDAADRREEWRECVDVCRCDLCRAARAAKSREVDRRWGR